MLFSENVISAAISNAESNISQKLPVYEFALLRNAILTTIDYIDSTDDSLFSITIIATNEIHNTYLFDYYIHELGNIAKYHSRAHDLNNKILKILIYYQKSFSFDSYFNRFFHILNKQKLLFTMNNLIYTSDDTNSFHHKFTLLHKLISKLTVIQINNDYNKYIKTIFSNPFVFMKKCNCLNVLNDYKLITKKLNSKPKYVNNFFIHPHEIIDDIDENEIIKQYEFMISTLETINLKISDDENEFDIDDIINLLLSIKKSELHIFAYINSIQFKLDNFIETHSATQMNLFEIFIGNSVISRMLLKNNLVTLNRDDVLKLYFKSHKNKIELSDKGIIFIYEFIKQLLTTQEINYIENYFELNKFSPEQLQYNLDLGENENYICELIRNDDIERFITYVTVQNIPFDMDVPFSDFESNYEIKPGNRFKIKLFEYAIFHGSITILKWLVLQKVHIRFHNSNDNFCDLMVHSGKSEMVYFLEDYRKDINSKTGNEDNYISLEGGDFYKAAVQARCYLIADYVVNNYEVLSYLINDLNDNVVLNKDL